MRCDTLSHDLPTTRSANFLPSPELAATPSGIVAAAILVMLIDEVFEAMIQDGFTASAKERNKDCFRGNDSETAY
jgi:hypothetical protein